MRAAIYARVSKDEMSSTGQLQDEMNQLEPLRQFCHGMQWTIIEEFVDRASGGGSDRPSFQKMMGMVRQHRFDMVLVWRLDRFSREGITNTLSYIRTMRESHCGLRSFTESWMDTSQEGIAELVLGVMSWAAAEERKKISQNTKAGLARRKALGMRLGRHPNGCQCSKHRSRNPEVSEGIARNAG